MADTLPSRLKCYSNSFQVDLVEMWDQLMEVLSENWALYPSFNRMDIPTTITAHALQIGLTSLALWTIYGVIYRLYLSPISSFPGPKLAALSFWYEFYYDIYPLYGQYTFHIRDLHEKYGPIIRINPHELHISTPEFYETLYSSNKKTDKWYWFTKMFGLDDSIFGTVDHDKHRARRAPLNPFFSVQSVRRLQPMIQERVHVCLERMRGLRTTGQLMNVVVVTSAFSNDVIMMYSFGRMYHRLEAPDFDVFNHDSNHEAGKMGFLMKHAIWILRIIQALPEFLLRRLSLDFESLVLLKNGMRRQVIQISKEKSTHEDLSYPTIFHALLNSNLPDQEKSVERLTDEAQVMIGAGQETVAWILTVIVCHLLSNPSVLRKLKEELAVAMPDPKMVIPEATLANLPYLTGVIKEGLRLGYGVSSRLARVPQEPLIFSTSDHDWIIPAGTPVSMTSVLIHHNETIFPDSKVFRPDRWIQGPRLDRYLVAFSKGSRQCLGMNLAYAEMYLWLAVVFRQFGSKKVRFESDEGVLELVDTDVSDVEIVADRFVPIVKPESKGVRVRVLS